MNKSEIAERAGREREIIRSIIDDLCYRQVCLAETRLNEEREKLVAKVVDSPWVKKAFEERAIAESRGQPPCASNSVTYASQRRAEAEEPGKCPTCHGYHLGGCHREKLGDGEPSSPPPTKKQPGIIMKKPDEVISLLNDLGSTWAVLRNCKDFMDAEKGLLGEYWKTLDKLMGEVFKTQVELMKCWRSGAAQEVSPVGPVQKITGPERPRCPVCGAETTCLSCKAGVEEVSPPSPECPQCHGEGGWADGEPSACPECGGAPKRSSLGDTRELKAALPLDELMAEYCETRAISRTGKVEAMSFAQFMRQREAERLLGEPT